MRATEHRTENKGHGRIEKRSGRVLDLTDHPDKAPLPHRTVAFRIERERRNTKTGKVEHETVHGLTSLPPPRTGHRRTRTRPRARSLEHRKSGAPRARRLLSRRPVPGADRTSAAQPRLPEQPGHLHRAHPATIRVHPPSPPALCETTSRRGATAPRTTQTLTPDSPATARRVPSGTHQRTGSSATHTNPHSDPRYRAPESLRATPRPPHAAPQPLLAVDNKLPETLFSPFRQTRIIPAAALDSGGGEGKRLPSQPKPDRRTT